jgi:hypothetical protein
MNSCVKTGCGAPAIVVVSYWHRKLLLPEMLEEDEKLFWWACKRHSDEARGHADITSGPEAGWVEV